LRQPLNHVPLYHRFVEGLDPKLSDYERILDLTFQNKKLTYFAIDNYGCCAEVVSFERHFLVDADFKCKLVIQRAILEGMKIGDRKNIMPDGYFDQPIKFRILNPRYALRYAPEISDSTPPGYKKDTTGREWWLVEMDPDEQPFCRKTPLTYLRTGCWFLHTRIKREVRCYSGAIPVAVNVIFTPANFRPLSPRDGKAGRNDISQKTCRHHSIFIAFG